MVVSRLLPGIRAEWNDLSTVSLTAVDRILAGMIGQKSWLSLEMLVDAIKVEISPPKPSTPSLTLFGQFSPKW